MITWNHLVNSLNQLSKLPNGNGSEIEFDLKGNSYIIIHYQNKCHFGKLMEASSHDSQEWKWEEKCYKNMDELGNAMDFGFCLMAEWKNVENLDCRPDFENIPLNIILDAYRDVK